MIPIIKSEEKESVNRYTQLISFLENILEQVIKPVIILSCFHIFHICIYNMKINCSKKIQARDETSGGKGRRALQYVAKAVEHPLPLFVKTD